MTIFFWDFYMWNYLIIYKFLIFISISKLLLHFNFCAICILYNWDLSLVFYYLYTLLLLFIYLFFICFLFSVCFLNILWDSILNYFWCLVCLYVLLFCLVVALGIKIYMLSFSQSTNSSILPLDIGT